MRLSILCAGLTLACWAGGSVRVAKAAPAEAPWRRQLTAAIAEAAAHNPEVAAMEQSVEAARHRAAEAGSWADPELELSLKDVPAGDFSLSRDEFTMQMVAVRQTLPVRGQRAAERALGMAAASQADAEHARHLAALVADVAGAFADQAQANGAIDLLERARQRVAAAAEVARSLYASGRGSQSDALRAGLDVTALEERRIVLESERRVAAARLAALLGRSESAEIEALGAPDGSDPDFAEGPQTLAVAPREQLLAGAEASSPALAVARANSRSAAAAQTLAALAGRPAWMVNGYYGRRQRYDAMVGAGVSMTLPWLHRERVAERSAAASAEVASADAMQQAAHLDLRRSLESAWSALERSRAEHALYVSSILPQAGAAYASAREAYAAGRADFTTVERAAGDLYLYQIEAAARAWDVLRAVAELQRVSGLPLLSSPMDPGGLHAQP